MLKVPKAGMQVVGGEEQGVLAFRREAILQRFVREMRARKSSTRSTELIEVDEETEVIDFGVRTRDVRKPKEGKKEIPGTRRGVYIPLC